MATQNFIVRKAKLSDAKELLKVFKNIIENSKWILSEPDEIAATLKDERKFIKRHFNKNSLLIIAESQRSIIGVLGAAGGSNRRNRHVVGIGVSVMKEWQGKGVGTAMMKRLINWSRKAGIKKIKLAVMTKNTPAIKLYKKVGFVTEGILKKDFRIGRHYYDGMTMAKFI